MTLPPLMLEPKNSDSLDILLWCVIVYGVSILYLIEASDEFGVDLELLCCQADR